MQGRLALPHMLLSGSEPTFQECSQELQYGVDYPFDLDLPDQRAALLLLYNSTGGPGWFYKEDDAVHDLFFNLLTDVEQYRESLSNNSGLNSTSILASSGISDLAALPALSGNCTLQQSLSFGQLLLKHAWSEVDRSYCQWHGVTCCKTAVSKCTQLLPSYACCCNSSMSQCKYMLDL